MILVSTSRRARTSYNFYRPEAASAKEIFSQRKAYDESLREQHTILDYVKKGGLEGGDRGDEIDA